MKQLFSNADLNFIKKTIVAAGERILKQSKIIVVHPEKAGGGTASLATQADIDTENFLRKHLGNRFPDFGFYSEETFKNNGKELEKEYCWVVDPIDGTLNFSRGLPIFGNSVALFHQAKPIFGAIYFPHFKDYFWAVIGAGAFRNTTSIHVRKPQTNSGWFGSFDYWHISAAQDAAIGNIIRTYKLESANMYSAVSHATRVAQGSFDFMAFINIALWDIGAGWILIEEAGGTFTTLFTDEKRKQAGDPYYLWCVGGPKQVVRVLHQEMRKLTQL